MKDFLTAQLRSTLMGLIFLADTLQAITLPANVDWAKIDEGGSFLVSHTPVVKRTDYIPVDSSISGYTMWTQMQECLAYNPILGNLQFVCRHFSTANINVNQTDSSFSLIVHNPMVYQGTLGSGRYPTSVASNTGGSVPSGPHISFPYLFPGPQWGGMGAQFESGGLVFPVLESTSGCGTR
ncbi:MAG: hypothetical protein ABIL70_05790 [candidate division WOR-3 bacterium]